MSSQACAAIGTVKAVTAGCVDVEFEPPARCRGCEGACFWYRLPAVQRISIETPLELTVGALVTVTLSESRLLVGTLLVYGLPLAAMLSGAALGTAASGSDLGAATGAVAGLVGAWAMARVWRPRFERATLRKMNIVPVR